MTLSSPVIGTVQVVGNTSGGTDYQLEAWTSGKTGETDNQGHLYGSPAGSSYTYTFQPGELITSMSLWLGEWDHVGDRAGATMFTTSLGNTFQHGYQGGSATVINVYSGILVGADIRAGDDLNAWGFAFLRPLVSCQLQDVTYGDLSMGSVSLQSLDSYSTNVAGDGSFSSSEQSSIQKTISSSWSQSEGVTSSMDVTVTATIPEIGEVGGAGAGTKYEWQESETYTSQASIQAVQTLTWSVNWTLVAGQSISLQAQTHTGSINVPYQGTMVVTVVETTGDPPTFSFETFNFPQSGTYTAMVLVGAALETLDAQDAATKLAWLLGHPTLVAAADAFKASPAIEIKQSGTPRFVCVLQKEFATATPEFVDFVGTDDATTCVGVGIRDPKSGLTSIGHLDFAGCVKEGLAQMLSSLFPDKDTILEVHMAGAYDDSIDMELREDEMGHSWPLCLELVEELQALPYKLEIRTLCILRHNTVTSDGGYPCPAVRGFAVSKDRNKVWTLCSSEFFS
ncbi:hypothetical protein SELMODRAFT_431469 [Selaginella moellendorffii]|uniref:Jacalin-type lectin domain-containing protein n=1 Tax=Selaginella moellendorffii TaxID=88036 RepID=D8TCR7_SELML|nr:hypothetical protein SELMODRAFT_431469 [Selaginella moellendorffii]